MFTDLHDCKDEGVDIGECPESTPYVGHVPYCFRCYAKVEYFATGSLMTPYGVRMNPIEVRDLGTEDKHYCRKAPEPIINDPLFGLRIPRGNK